MSVTISKKALRLPGINGYPEALARARLCVGSAFMEKNPDSAYYYYSDALSIAKTNELSDLKASIFYNISNLFIYVNDYKRSLLFLDSALRISRSARNFTLVANIYNDIGTIKMDLYDSANAKIMFRNSYRIANEHNLNKQKGIAFSNLARFEKNPGKRSVLNKMALNILLKEKGTEESRASIMINLGNAAVDPDSAIRYYKAAIHTVDKELSYLVHIGAYNNMVYSYLEKKEYNKALECLNTHAFPLAIKHNNTDWIAALYDTYADVMVGMGKFREGMDAEKKAYLNNLKAYDKHVTGQVLLLATLLEVKDKELTIQNVTQELRQKEVKINLLVVLLAAIIVLVASIILFFVQRNKLNAQRQILDSAKQIIDLDEKMKRNLAMELHDLTSPLCYGLKNLSENKLIAGTVVMEEFVQLSNFAESIRQVSHQISTGLIEKVTLAEMVINFCLDVQYMTSAKILPEINTGNLVLSSEKETQVFRIVQEVMTNGVKYVKDGEIRISLSTEQENLCIIYDDNGPGFKVAEGSNKGLGLSNIFERTKLLGGKAVLKSEPFKGTHWFISFPV